MRVLSVLLLVCCTRDPRDTGARTEPEDHLSTAALEVSTRAMTDLGARQVATDEELLARDAIAASLEASGLRVALEPFTFDAWLPGAATLTIGDDQLTVEALSPSPETHLVAPLHDGGGDFRDGIALMSSDDASRAEQFIQAALGGAVAMIRVTEALDFDGEPLVEVGHMLEGATLPGLAVDRVIGDRLRAALGTDVGVDIVPRIVAGHTSHNVVTRIAGRSSGTVYVVAHYDSWHPSESAFDNAVGVGALVQIGRQLADHAVAPEKEIVLIATSAEEQGLRGAIAWVEQHAEEIGPGDLVITLDVLWSGEGTFLVQASDDALRQVALEAAAAEGLDAVDGSDPGLGSDHFPFVMEGADAVWCGRWPDRHYHTVHDTLDRLDLDEAAAAMRSQWRLLAHAAGFDHGLDQSTR